MRISDWSSDVCSSDLIADRIVPVDGDRARRRRHDAADDADQRRLTLAVGAEQRENLAAFDVEIDRLQRAAATVLGLAYARYRQDRDHIPPFFRKNQTSGGARHNKSE